MDEAVVFRSILGLVNWRRSVLTVTPAEVRLAQGTLIRSERVVGLGNVTDVTVESTGPIAYVRVHSAGTRAFENAVGPFRTGDARRARDCILAARSSLTTPLA